MTADELVIGIVAIVVVLVAGVSGALSGCEVQRLAPGYEKVRMGDDIMYCYEGPAQEVYRKVNQAPHRYEVEYEERDGENAKVCLERED